MKRLIMLFTVLSFFSLTMLYGQVPKGKIFVGVSTGINYVSFGSDIMSLKFTTVKQKSDAPGFVESSDEKTTTINLLPKVGYFFSDNLVVGLDAILSSYTDKYASDDKSTTTIMGAGPFIRYYLSGTRVMPFFEVSGLFGSLNNKYTYQSSSGSYKTGVILFGGGAGIAVKLGDKATFDIMAGYSSMTTKAKENNDNNERTVSGSLGVKFGFVFILGAE